MHIQDHQSGVNARLRPSSTADIVETETRLAVAEHNVIRSQELVAEAALGLVLRLGRAPGLCNGLELVLLGVNYRDLKFAEVESK